MNQDTNRSPRPKLFPPLALARQPQGIGGAGFAPLPLSGHKLRRIVADMIG